MNSAIIEDSSSIDANSFLKILSAFYFIIPGYSSFVRIYAVFPSEVILINCSSSFVCIPTNFESIKSVKICLK